jgi:guanine nucleotide-binding protein G(i) subunit alpha
LDNALELTLPCLALRKQLSNVHNTIFQNDAHRKTFATAVVTNLIDGVLEVLMALNKKDDTYNLLENFGRQAPVCLDDKITGILNGFLNDPEFQKIAQGHGHELVQLQDCWFVFAEELKQYPVWGGAGWIPSADDCVRSRVRTSGVIKEELEIDGIRFMIYDVGGQRAERRKWLHMFDTVMSCIYVAALSEYDQVLFEDRTKNRLEEALELFAETINSAWLSQATALLFLNKKDLFHKKYSIDKVPLNISGKFPQAPEGNENEEAAIQWISKEFTSRKKATKGNNKIYVHITTATDASNIKAVFKVTKDTILSRNMAMAGFTSS